MSRVTHAAVTCVAGLVLPLSMAPLNWHLLAFVSVMCFVHMIYRYATQRMMLAGLGLLYGFGVYAMGIHWLYISLHTVMGIAWPLAFCMVALVVVVLAALFFMPLAVLAGLILQRDRRWFVCALVLPSLWVCFELFKTYAFSGFPWLLLGYSQLGWPLAGIAPILGVYGASWLTVLTAVCLYHVLVTNVLAVRVTLMGAVVLLWLVMAGLYSIQWTQAYGDPKTVNIIQPNVSLYDKWNRASLPYLLDHYSQQLSSSQAADLNVLPEAALPTVSHPLVQQWLQDQRQIASMHHSHTVLGAMIDDGPYNGLLMLGRQSGRYVKQHLVPFGEYVPFRAVFGPIGDWLNIPMSNLQSMHSSMQSLAWGALRLTPAICYETAYPIEFAHKVLQTKGQLLLAVSEDGWFGDSMEPFQHLQTAQMRSLETGRELIFATNQGVSAAIDAHGVVKKQSSLQQVLTLHATVQPYAGITPWLRWGKDSVLWLHLCLLSVALLVCHGGQWRAAWFRKKWW